MKIYKYKLRKDISEQKIEMPHNAQILKVDYQNGELKLWALVDTTTPTRTYFVSIFGTGWDIKTTGDYVDTVFDNEFVWHIFIN